MDNNIQPKHWAELETSCNLSLKLFLRLLKKICLHTEPWWFSIVASAFAVQERSAVLKLYKGGSFAGRIWTISFTKPFFVDDNNVVLIVCMCK